MRRRGLFSSRQRSRAGVLKCLFADYIVIGSDSGRIVILEYNPSKNMFEKIHQETFGKSGCRRIVPGQFLAVDPKGRAVMIGEVMGRSGSPLVLLLASLSLTRRRVVVGTRAAN